MYAQLLSGFSGVAIAAQISLSVKDRPMREVIKELEETTEYRFFYNDGIKGLNSPISVDVEESYRYDYRPERGTNHRGECGRERIYQWYHHGYRWPFLY